MAKADLESNHWLFGKERTRQAIILHDPSFEQIQNLRKKGFELVVDHGTRAHLTNYAAEFCGLYIDPCPLCGHYTELTAICTGQRFRQDRWQVFRNLKLCEMCQQDTESVRITRSRTILV